MKNRRKKLIDKKILSGNPNDSDIEDSFIDEHGVNNAIRIPESLELSNQELLKISLNTNN